MSQTLLFRGPRPLTGVELSGAGTWSRIKAHPAAVVTAMLADKAILAGMLFIAFPGVFGHIYFTF